jgi:serine/threonine-protein kinase RsbW
MLFYTSTLDLVPDDNAVALAMQWLETIAAQEEWPSPMTFGLLLSLDESLTNIVSYAFIDGTLNGDEPAVTLSLHQEGSELRLELADNGRPYNATLATLPPVASTLDEAEIGGQGLRLIRHCMKNIAYRYEHGRNHLTLITDCA